ncbi:MAG: hypothetical protein LIO62_00125 [Clostridiales bacterium]|nr:hypothetical protein [Clostridiales bacterium]
MAENNNENFLQYKGRPLVRCNKTIYYGNMYEPFVICLNVLSEKDVKDLQVSDRVVVQLVNTDINALPKDRIVKKSEKQGLFNALDLGAVWLERALKNYAESEQSLEQ